MKTVFRFCAGFSLVLSLAGCFPGNTHLPVSGDELEAAVDEQWSNATVVQLNEANVLQYAASAQAVPPTASVPGRSNWVYRVGSRDVLKIIVWGVSELADPSEYIEGAPAPGSVVQADGNVYFPYVGTISVRGKTIPEIREELTVALSEFFPEPQVEVRVIEFNSQSAIVAGAVEVPNRYPLSATPTHLLDLVSAAGTSDDLADLSRIVLRRGGRSYPINLNAFVESGLASANPLILDGDTVFVPHRAPQEAFVLGEVNAAQSVSIDQRDVSLTQILSEAGGLDLLDADARGVFVFRNDQNGVTVFQLDVSNPSAYLIGTRFLMKAQDVVYVTTDPVSRWNRAITDLLPSVTLYQSADNL